MESYDDNADACVPPDPDKNDDERCCEGALIQERRGSMLQLGSLIFDALNSPYSLVNMLRTVITLLTAWRALIPDESPWYVFKNYCGDGDDEDDEAELSPEQTRRITAAGFVFNAYMSFFDDIAPGPLHIQQEKDPNAPDINRAFDGLDAPLAVALIKAAVASADENLARKEAEAAALAEKTAADELAKCAASEARAASYLTRTERVARKKAAHLNPPRATDLSLNTSTPASDGGSSTDGIPVKNPNPVDGSLSYAPMAESTLLGESVGTASMNLTSPTCGALHATDLSLDTASAPMGGSPGYVNDAVSRSYFTRSRSSGDGGGRRSLGDSFRSLSGF
jgi:hypothetical protein